MHMYLKLGPFKSNIYIERFQHAELDLQCLSIDYHTLYTEKVRTIYLSIYRDLEDTLSLESIGSPLAI